MRKDGRATHDEQSYRELAPGAALRPWVECFWERREARPAARSQILPDGCADFLFDRAGGRAWLIGAMSRPFEFVPDGPVDLFAVRFRPGGAHAVLRAALEPWTDGRLELGELGRWGSRLAALVEDELAPGELALRVEAALVSRLANARVDAVDRVLREMERDPAAFRVGPAADSAALSRQWLTRVVRARAGLGPKALAAILRLRRTLAAANGGRGLAEAALAGGYADQAHFTREARRITGSTPTTLVAARGA